LKRKHSSGRKAQSIRIVATSYSSGVAFARYIASSESVNTRSR
jgi:hypothetical protein